MIIVGIFLFLLVMSISAQATGLIDQTINSNNNYSKYPVDNYQLDYFVDSSWDWLPWNWGDGIGKSVMYGIYAITNFFWLLSIYVSNATGYLIGEAYSLDFIRDTTNAIGKNIQNLAGINQNGFMSSGFYPGLILLLLLVLGVYVTYTGLMKRETTKATSAIISFLAIFILSASFIAYSTSYISKINEFSSDISNAALAVGSKMTTSGDTTGEKNSVDLIRDSLFEIQVKQPWMILQYGDSDSKTVGKERVEKLESTSPFQNKGKDRVEIVKKEINDKENDNMTITKTINRLGVTIFIFFFNGVISFFVFLLTGIMIFSQVLFILFAVFLPISFLLSMIPGFNHLMKSTIMRLFNVIMMRAGITLVLTLAFSLSTMVYALTASKPFFIVAFMQIVIFAGIYFKLNDLMGMMSLKSGDSRTVGGQVMRRPKQVGRQALRKMAVGSFVLSSISNRNKNKRKTAEREDSRKSSDTQEKKPLNNREATAENSLAKTKQTTQQKQLETQKNQRQQKLDQKQQQKLDGKKLVKENNGNPKKPVTKQDEKKKQSKDPLFQSKDRIESAKKKPRRQPAKIRNLDSLYKDTEVKYFQPKLGAKSTQLDNTKELLNQSNQKKVLTKAQNNTLRKSSTPKAERDGIHGKSLNKRVDDQKSISIKSKAKKQKTTILTGKGMKRR